MPIVIVIVIFLIWFIFQVIGVYNRIVRLNQVAVNAGNDIEIYLKQRTDLIVNLVASTQGYMHYEQDLLECLTKLRTQANTQKGLIDADAQYSKLLPMILAQASFYPKLKADKNFKTLNEQLIAVEKEIAARRASYNHSATEYNIYISSFPGLLIRDIAVTGTLPLFEASSPDPHVDPFHSVNMQGEQQTKRPPHEAAPSEERNGSGKKSETSEGPTNTIIFACMQCKKPNRVQGIPGDLHGALDCAKCGTPIYDSVRGIPFTALCACCHHPNYCTSPDYGTTYCAKCSTPLWTKIRSWKTAAAP